MTASRTAVVLFNLGGPDRQEDVRSFLMNMFRDRAILDVPTLLRWPLAWMIATLRAGKAKEIYANLGGGSPLLANTEAQARALSVELGPDFSVFVAMRYWSPRSAAVVRAVKRYDPAEIVLVPLYPQFSTATAASSISDWHVAARHTGLVARTHAVCCYPTERGWIDAVSQLVRDQYADASAHGKPRILFSAHGLPVKVVAQGDPYQWQIEETAKAVVRSLAIEGLDWSVCYQSRVGPLEWIGPSTESEIERAGRDRIPVVVVPIAFVSEHSETLVELDVEYRKRAADSGVPQYARVPAVSTHPVFVAGLARIVRDALARPEGICSAAGGRLCPLAWKRCPAVA